MIDHKTNLTRDLIESLSTHFGASDLSFIEESLTKILTNYDVKDSCTAVAIRDDKNERLLKRYAACLSVDGKSKRTIALYVRRLTVLSEFLQVPFDQVTTYDIRFYLATIKDSGVSSRTLENYRSYISAFFQWMAKEDIIPKNPCDKINPIKYTEEVRLPFSDIEIDSLRSFCKNERDRALVELLLSSGVRVTELVDLNISDIDFTTLSVHARSGKGQKERITYMTDVCAMHLKKYLYSRPSHPALFISARKKNRLTTSGVRRILHNIGNAAHVPDVHPHRFRRTLATNLSKRGMDVQTIGKLLGHSNIQTTMIYVTMDDTRINTEYKKHTA